MEQITNVEKPVVVEPVVMVKLANLAAAALRETDGTIDVSATLAAVEEQLWALIDEEATSGVRIAAAVNAVFTTYKGKVLTMPSLVNAALAQLDVTPATFAAESEAVAEYVRRTPLEFKIAKGKGGGVSRIVDAPPPKPEKA